MPFKPSHPIRHPATVTTDDLINDLEAYKQVIHSLGQIYSNHGKTSPAGLLSLGDSLVVSIHSSDKSDFKDEIKGSQAVLNDIQKQMRNGGLNWLEKQDRRKVSVFKEKLNTAQDLLDSVIKLSNRI